MPRASWDFLGSLQLSIPPLNEQEVIATFLDRETAKIDALITEQQRLIELLQEKRQAVISHAVTKGLNPDAPMKDSGVEWLGEVPEHWEVRKFAWDFVSAMGQTILREDLEDTGLPIFSATEDDRYFGLISNPKVHLEPGDIVIPARGNCIGAVKLVKEPASATQTTIYAKQISSKFSADYIFYFLRFNREHLFPMTRTAIPQITVTEVGSNRVCLPPVTEQRQIVEYIHSIDRAFQELMSESGSGIALLQERRSALISAAVTGQIDVRGLAPETSGA
jgi:type I restriction enzyme S subunit